MAEQKCPLCGEEMSFDEFTGSWVCSICGYSVREQQNPEMGISVAQDAAVPVSAPQDEDHRNMAPVSKEDQLQYAISMIQDHKYEKAMNILSALRKEKDYYSKSFILMLFCGYKMNSMAELLKSLSGNTPALCKIAERSDWTDLAMALPEDKRKFIAFVIEYCATAIVLSGNAKMVIQRTSVPSRKPASAIARMDEEELHNKERAESLKKAKDAEYGQTFSEKVRDRADAMGDFQAKNYCVTPYEPQMLCTSQEDDSWKYTPLGPDEDGTASKSGSDQEKGKPRSSSEVLSSYVATKQRVKREQLEKREKELLEMISGLESDILSL